MQNIDETRQNNDTVKGSEGLKKSQSRQPESDKTNQNNDAVKESEGLKKTKSRQPESDKTNQNNGAAKGSEDAKKGKKHGKLSKYLYRALGVVILISVVLSVEHIAYLSFYDTSSKDYFITDVKRLEEENAQVDMIITGASKVYHGCDPDIISEEMGLNEVVDCASAGAANDSVYFMLKDLLERFEPKYVVLTFGWTLFYSKGNNDLKQHLLAGDRISLANRILINLECNDPLDWPNIFYMYRYGGTVWGLSQIKYYFNKRMAIFRGDWEEDRNYKKNGYRFSNYSSPKGSIPAERKNYDKEREQDYLREYFAKMVEMCQDRGIQVFMVSMPVSTNAIYNVNNIGEANENTEAFAAELGCEYIDFNLMKNRDTLFPDGYFKDHIHMCKTGAEAFSHILGETLNKVLNGEDISSMFYDNVDEMKKDVTRIVGCNGKVIYQEDGSVHVNVWSNQNEDIIPEYRLVLTDKKKHSEEGETENELENELEGELESSDVDADSAGDESAGAAGEADASENAENTDEDTSGEVENVEGIELRTWQTGADFVLDASELPPDKALRLETRQVGETTVEAYQDDILNNYVV